MRHQPAPWTSPVEALRTLSRRALLRASAYGGAGLWATLASRNLTAQQSASPQNTMELLKTLPVAHRRRVVTGHNADGKSYIVSDEIIPDNSGGPLGSSLERMADGGAIPGHMDLWATSPAQPLGPGPADEPRGILSTTSPHVDPVKGGTRWYIATLPPGFNGSATMANRQGMHRTLTIDLVFVLSGEITMIMDVPPEVKLKAGDVIVQRNTFHSWRVDGKTPVSLLATLVRVGD